MQVQLVLQVTQDTVDTRVIQVHQVIVVPLAHQDTPVLLDIQDNQATLEFLDLVDTQDFLVIAELVDLVATQEYQDTQVLVGILVHLAIVVLADTQELLVTVEPQGFQDTVVFLDTLVFQVIVVLVVTLVHQDILVQVDILGLVDIQEYRVILE